ncbi:MAG: hypothetical protein M1826_000801 [Phylliscum demangeonii]|nr:MAG: hypothetical protein M1826_000801 [Phylliscum demangeonii]
MAKKRPAPTDSGDEAYGKRAKLTAALAPAAHPHAGTGGKNNSSGGYWTRSRGIKPPSPPPPPPSYPCPRSPTPPPPPPSTPPAPAPAPAQAAATTSASSGLDPSLPALPAIGNKALMRQVFTHQGSLSSENSQRNDLSYERLEFLGDAYLEIIVSEMIYYRYGHLGPAGLSRIRESFVRNESLAIESTRYGLYKRLRLGFSPKGDGPAMKVRADVFEAYIAAIVLSAPSSAQGMAIVQAWLAQLWEPRLAEWDHLYGSRTPGPAPAPAPASATPSATSATATAGAVGKKRKPDAAAKKKAKADAAAKKEMADTAAQQEKPDSVRLLTAKSDLARQLLAPGATLEYRDDRPPEAAEPGRLKFHVCVYLTGWGYTRRCLGSGAANSKQTAGAHAALDALKNHAALIAEAAAARSAWMAATKAERQLEKERETQRQKEMEMDWDV